MSNKATKQSKIHYVAVDDTTKVVKLMIRTSPEGELPMKFEPRYMAVAKEIPDELVQKLIGQEAERITNNIQNRREWWEYAVARKKELKAYEK